MQITMGLIIGVGLAAACGFRVFVPLLGMSIASLAGHLTLAPGFEWIGTWPALVALATATVLEIAAYYLPWLDNLLDTVATPAAIVAGTIVTASQLGDLSPLLKWSLAIIAGGGVCGVIQTGTVVVRAASTGTTGGLGNVAVSSFELFASLLMTMLAIVLPIFGIVVVIAVFGAMAWQISKWLGRRQPPPLELQTSTPQDLRMS